MCSMRSVLAAAALLAAGVATAAAQSPAPAADWLWAAQTGPNLVTLVWQAVPGAAEYQIYLGDPSAPGTFLPRPVSRLGANSRRASLTGMARVTNGIRLVVVDASNRVLQQAEFNRITPATSFAPPTPTTTVTAQATGTSEITVTWDSVPGATGYMIGRAVPPGGFSMRCALCPMEPRFVDRDVSPGLPHKYMVAAIFPSGKVSTRVVSGAVTPGATQVAATPASTPSGNPGAVTTATAGTPTGQPAGIATMPATSPPPGIPAGATTTPTPAIPPGTPQPATDSVPVRVNPQIPATVPDTAPPTIGPPPSGAESLVVPADTGSCIAARAAPDTAAVDSLGRIDPRTIGIDLRTTGSNPDANTATSWIGVTTTNLGSADYRQGKCLNPGATGYPDLWDPVAAASGMTSAERVAAWKEIGIVALEYKHILERAPTPEETRRDVAALKAGTSLYQLWRQLAHSPERDQRFGYWAPAPLSDSVEAKTAFGLTVPPWTAQQCYGGLGPKCGGLPEAINLINDRVYAYWFGAFKMPDGTEFAYIEMGVAVGSILHDNACLQHKDGLNCNGLGAGDLVKNIPEPISGTALYSPASLEWNKAAWNLLDGRTWRARFGPYPLNLAFRDRYWYDDLRPATQRPAMMAPAVSMFTWPGLTVTYTGGETRRTRGLEAPPGTSLDNTDAAFCRGGTFTSLGSFPGKAPWGICMQGAPTTGPHAATPIATGTPTTATPTTSTPTTATPAGTPVTATPTPPASCKLDYQRADNMWAAFGRPDGPLGVESISLALGANKIFITDWKYEKQRNDGTTYYGSHLRIATNSSSRAVRLQLVTLAGASVTWVSLNPNTTMQFQADLREVYCQ